MATLSYVQASDGVYRGVFGASKTMHRRCKMIAFSTSHGMVSKFWLPQ